MPVRHGGALSKGTFVGKAWKADGKTFFGTVDDVEYDKDGAYEM